MKRLLISLVVAVGAVRLCPAAGPLTAGVQRPEPLELVLLGKDKLARLELVVEVDGKAVTAIWDQTFVCLFAFFDRNGDGMIDEKEAVHLPSALALRQALGSGFTPPVGAPPWFADLDRDGNGKVTPVELAGFYRRAGLGNLLIGVGRLPASKELTAALLKRLDADGDGKVVEKEGNAAPQALKKLDKNDDELIGAGELVPKAVYPGTAGTTLLTPATAGGKLPEVLAKLPLILLPQDKQDNGWATEVIRRRHRDGDGRLSRARSGLDTAVFALLDSDKDGKLTAEELAGWRKQKPDARWVIRLGGKSKTTARLAFTGGRLRFEAWATEGKLADAVASARREMAADFDRKSTLEGETNLRRRVGLSWLNPVADRDGNGRLDAKEFNSWLDLQKQIAQGQVLLTLLDGGAGLFELLDLDHDGALSMRELRGAWKEMGEAGCLTEGAFDRSKLPHFLLAAVSHGYPKSFGADLRHGPAWFRAMDRNGDGYVSPREFTGKPEQFEKLDGDKDGLLSAEEAERARK